MMVLLPVRGRLGDSSRQLLRSRARGSFSWARHPIGWIVLVGAATALGGCAGAGAGGRVASVDGHAITAATFRHWLGIIDAESGDTASDLPEPPHYLGCVRHLLSSAPKSKPKPTTAALQSSCASRYRALREATLGFLIPAQWLLAEAPRLGVAISDAEVKKELVKAERGRFPHTAEFERFLASSRYTVSDLLLRMKLNLLSAALERKVVKGHSKVTDADVEKYYNENKARFAKPETRAVYIILTKTERAARRARSEIQSGERFSSVAKKVSIDAASRSSGGLRREMVKGEDDKKLDQAIFSAKPNVLSGPIETSRGYYLFSVKSVSPGSESPLSKVTSQIKAQLAASRESQALSSFIKAFRARWIEKTDCSSGYVVIECRGYKGSRRG